MLDRRWVWPQECWVVSFKWPLTTRGNFAVGVISCDTVQNVAGITTSSQNDEAMDSILRSAKHQSCGVVSFGNKGSRTRLQRFSTHYHIPFLECPVHVWVIQAQRSPVERGLFNLILPKFSQMCLARGQPDLTQCLVEHRIGCTGPWEIKWPHGSVASIGSLRNPGLNNLHPVPSKNLQWAGYFKSQPRKGKKSPQVEMIK